MRGDYGPTVLNIGIIKRSFVRGQLRCDVAAEVKLVAAAQMAQQQLRCWSALIKHNKAVVRQTKTLFKNYNRHHS